MGALVQGATAAGAALAKMADSGAQSMTKVTDATKQQQTALKQATREWEQAMAPVTSAFNQSFNAILKGTETTQQAVRKFSQSLVSSLISDTERSVENWLAGELAKTTATQIGATARATADNQGQSVGLVKLAELALQAIGIDAAKTFADIFAFFAPDLGPAAAAPAEAAAAAVSGGAHGLLPRSATGAWDVPADMPAYIHRGEAILPADFASGFRAAVSGGGARGAAPSAQFSIQAMDGASVRRVLGNNHGAVAEALRKAWRSGSGHLR